MAAVAVGAAAVVADVAAAIVEIVAVAATVEIVATAGKAIISFSCWRESWPRRFYPLLIPVLR
jgi:hypothetical protein